KRLTEPERNSPTIRAWFFQLSTTYSLKKSGAWWGPSYPLLASALRTEGFLPPRASASSAVRRISPHRRGRGGTRRKTPRGHAKPSVPLSAGPGKSASQETHSSRSRGTSTPHAGHDSSTGHA